MKPGPRLALIGVMSTTLIEVRPARAADASAVAATHDEAWRAALLPGRWVAPSQWSDTGLPAPIRKLLDAG
mgnify:CR=1 FL=1